MRKLNREEITKAIADSNWQSFRISLKGLPTNAKMNRLKNWYRGSINKKKAEIQVINYINALKRGGLIK